MNNLALAFAQAHRASWSVGDIAVAVIIVVAILAVMIVATRVMGFDVPVWVWHIVAICVVAFLAILAIRFLLTL